MKYEFKKTLNTFRFILIIIFVILIQLVLSIYKFEPKISTDIEQKIYNTVSGKYTDEHLHYIKELREIANDAKYKIDEAKINLESGKISNSEFLVFVAKYSELANSIDDINKIYSKYSRLNSNSKSYMLYDENISTYLLKEDIPFALIVGILFLCTEIFRIDYTSGMQDILISTPNGRKRLFIKKIFISILTCMVLVFLVSITEFLVYCIRCGSYGFDFPVQSIEAYEDFTKDLTIWQVCLCVIICRLLGAIYLGCIISFVTVIFKSIHLSVFITIFVSVVPYFLFTNVNRYIIPLPCGLLIGNGFIFPDTEYLSVVEGTEKISLITTEMSVSEIKIVITIVICVMVMMNGITFYYYKKGDDIK